MGTQINNRKTFLILAGILSPFFLAFFLVIAVIEPEETEKKEPAITVSVPQKLQQTTSGQIAGVLEGPTVVNITTAGKLQQTTSGQIAGVLEGPTVVNITTPGNSSNETE